MFFVQGRYTLHTVCESERTQILTKHALSLQNYREIAVTFATSEAPLPGSTTVHFSSHHCTKQIIVLIASLYTLITNLCTFTLLPNKHMIMKLPSLVIIIHEILFNSILVRMTTTFIL